MENVVQSPAVSRRCFDASSLWQSYQHRIKFLQALHQLCGFNQGGILPVWSRAAFSQGCGIVRVVRVVGTPRCGEKLSWPSWTQRRCHCSVWKIQAYSSKTASNMSMTASRQPEYNMTIWIDCAWVPCRSTKQCEVGRRFCKLSQLPGVSNLIFSLKALKVAGRVIFALKPWNPDLVLWKKSNNQNIVCVWCIHFLECYSMYIYISYIYYINSSDFYVFSLCLLDLRNVAFQAWSWCEFLRWVWTKWFLAGKLLGFGRHESFKDSGDSAQRPHPTWTISQHLPLRFALTTSRRLHFCPWRRLHDQREKISQRQILDFSVAIVIGVMDATSLKAGNALSDKNLHKSFLRPSHTVHVALAWLSMYWVMGRVFFHDLSSTLASFFTSGSDLLLWGVVVPQPWSWIGYLGYLFKIGFQFSWSTRGVAVNGRQSQHGNGLEGWKIMKDQKTWTHMNPLWSKPRIPSEYARLKGWHFWKMSWGPGVTFCPRPQSLIVIAHFGQFFKFLFVKLANCPQVACNCKLGARVPALAWRLQSVQPLDLNIFWGLPNTGCTGCIFLRSAHWIIQNQNYVVYDSNWFFHDCAMISIKCGWTNIVMVGTCHEPLMFWEQATGTQEGLSSVLPSVAVLRFVTRGWIFPCYSLAFT